MVRAKQRIPQHHHYLKEIYLLWLMIFACSPPSYFSMPPSFRFAKTSYRCPMTRWHFAKESSISVQLPGWRIILIGKEPCSNSPVKASGGVYGSIPEAPRTGRKNLIV